MFSPISCRLSAAGIRFLGYPVSAEDFNLPCGRPTGHDVATGPQRGCHVPHERDTTGSGASYTPGLAVFSDRGWVYRAAPAAFQRPVLTPLPHPICGAHHYETSMEVHAIHPFGLLLHLWFPDGTETLGLDHLSSAPRRYRQRTSGWRQATEH